MVNPLEKVRTRNLKELAILADGEI